MIIFFITYNIKLIKLVSFHERINFYLKFLNLVNCKLVKQLLLKKFNKKNKILIKNSYALIKLYINML